MKPALAFACGDPGGVGPEIAIKAMRDARVRRVCRPIAVGPRSVWLAAGWTPGVCELSPWGSDVKSPHGRPTAAGGRISYEVFKRCLALSARGVIDGMVSAPVSKTAWRAAGIKTPDQTALIARETGAKRIGMMIAAGGLRAVLATRHVSHAGVPAVLSGAAISEAAHLASEALSDGLGVRRPRLGLCALNPHGGENGLLGREEKTIIKPSAVRLRREGLRIEGPLPADAAWSAHAAGKYDALVAMYHDQVLIPLKLTAGFSLVNWTIGAPVIRTAPGHGTAYDIAGRGCADASGMIAAALFAADIFKARRKK